MYQHLVTIFLTLTKIRTFNSPDCDPVTFNVEGRATRNGAWTPIGSGDLPWKDAALNRNAMGQSITSSPDSGDTALYYTEINLTNNAAFLDYKLTFDETRSPDSTYLQFAEVELSGFVMEEINTLAPQTMRPTEAPTPDPTPSVSHFVVECLFRRQALLYLTNLVSSFPTVFQLSPPSSPPPRSQLHLHRRSLLLVRLRLKTRVEGT